MATDPHPNPCVGGSHNPPLPLRGADACSRRLATSSEVGNVLASMCRGGGGAVGVTADASGGSRRDFAPVRQMMSTMLSRSYETIFERMLAEVALATTDLDVPLVPFWPIRGAAYDGELLVIGRSVNGWIEDWTARQLREAPIRQSAVERMRSNAEPADRCRMGWVTELWDAREGYNTHRSAFWRVLRRIVLSDTTPGLDDSRWSSRLAWTNLYKVSPAAGWNPPRGSPPSAASVGDRTA